MTTEQADVIDVDLSGADQEAPVHVHGEGVPGLTRYLSALRMDIAAYRGFLERIDLDPWERKRLIRLSSAVEPDPVHGHTFTAHTIPISLGAALYRVKAAHAADFSVTEADGERMVARDLTDALIHLVGHVKNGISAEPLNRDTRFTGNVTGLIASGLFVSLLGVPGIFQFLWYEVFHLYTFCLPPVIYAIAFPLGEKYRGWRQSRAGAVARAREALPTTLSEVYADESPFFTVELTPFHNWYRWPPEN